MQPVHLCREFFLTDGGDYFSVFQHVMAIGQWGGKTEILFDHDDGEAPLLEFADDFAQFPDDDRCQAFSCLLYTSRCV